MSRDEIASVQTDLRRGVATVRLAPGGQSSGGVAAGPFHFNPAGLQNEKELEELALIEARRMLVEAIATIDETLSPR